LCSRLRTARRKGAVTLVAAVATLAGCGGSQPPIGGLGVIQQSANERRPDRDAPRSALLYVSDPGAHKVLMYSYPQLQPKGTIAGISTPRGLCVDPATQNVWVVASYPLGEIIEFQHGATHPLRNLKLGGGANISGCAMSPMTGDLAVASHNQGSDPGALYVFKNARGKPKYYGAPGPTMYWPDFVAYDSGGNAFVDGSGARYTIQVAELAPGATKLHIVTPAGLSGDSPGGVYFNDTNLTIGNEQRALIYQIADGDVTGKTTLGDACRVWQFVIAGDRAIAPNACRRGGRVSIYDYPAGGAPLKVLTGLQSPFAAVISR
jgi:hypothetical protein